jgi:hypothetical protein
MENALARLAAERSRTNRSTLLTLIVALGVLGLLSCYFYWGYQQFAPVAQPNLLVDAADQWVNDKVPEIRQQMEVEITKSAPTWAKTLSKQAIDGLPTARQRLEDYIVERVDAEAEKTIQLSSEHFRETLQKNKPEIQKLFKDLETSDTLAEAQVDTLEKMLEAELSADMKRHSADFLEALGSVNDQLARFRDGKDLTEVEEIKRRLLLLARAIQARSSTGTQPVTLAPLYPQVARPVSSAPSARRKDSEPEVKATEAPKAEGGEVEKPKLEDAPKEPAEKPKSDQ